MFGCPVHSRGAIRRYLNHQVRCPHDFLGFHPIQMRVKHNDDIRLKHILWLQIYIDRSREDTPKTSKFDMYPQIGSYLKYDSLMLWTRRWCHHEHSIHNLITLPIIRKSSILVIGPKPLWWSRHPISRNDHGKFFLRCYHGNPTSL